MSWHAYAIAPIDHTWVHLKTVTETLQSLAQHETQTSPQLALEFHEVRDFMQSWEAAKQAARDIGWEGDFRGEPVVFWLPTEEFEFGFAFKQDNNGTTYIVSPVALPWLEQPAGL